MVQLKLSGLTCEGCAQTVDRALSGVPGVERVAVYYPEGVAEVEGEASLEALVRAVREAGYGAEPLDPERPGAVPKPMVGEKGSYDLVVIGSGSAGVAAALEAAGRGARVLVVEGGTLGGTCVNVGCVPSKTLLRAGEAAQRARHAGFPGVEARGAKVDFAEVARARDGLVGELRERKYREVLEAAGVAIKQGRARFTAPDRLEVDGEPLAARAYLVATGAEPVLPPIPGLERGRVWTYLDATTTRERPESLVVIGAGPVGLELAQAFRRLGSRVVVLEAQDRILPAEDEELAALLRGYLEEEGLQIVTGARVERIEGREVRTIGGVYEGERVLVATGRRARTRGLGLEDAGVELDTAGFVRVNDALRTSNPRVLAAGDVAGLPQFVYIAAQSGRVAAQNALGASATLDLTAVPRVTFTDPALAAVGLGEAEARARHGEDVRAATLDLADLPRALAAFDTRGRFKIVVDAGGRVLGLHVVAPEAGDVIAEGALVVRLGLGYRELIETFHPYLTLAEGVRLVAQALDQDVHRLSCCA
ncbi:mercury(II) reductase [Oceanithermus desulfurans]|uniref:Mercuric reductase n=2 Tax=Oceanithermus desulfurans TaxID=227924 RepID=A0A511RJP8_9DEIN|nr:mercury(II) reductase [Oceanithermus desulfurans]MBB6029906.1 mercury(II) reductase [Oceanithermus desulfurans]GEM89869.1 mercury(II) reductase [Oceanithermus desulfurans NBRC 100063]